MVQNTRKVTEHDFLGKLPLAQIWAKRPKMAQEWAFSTFSQNSGMTLGWKQAKMLDIMVRMYGTPSIYLGKLLFGYILVKALDQSTGLDQSDCFIFKVL